MDDDCGDVIGDDPATDQFTTQMKLRKGDKICGGGRYFFFFYTLRLVYQTTKHNHQKDPNIDN